MKAKKIIIQGIIPFFLTMIIVSCLLWVLGTSPFEVFITLLEGSFGTTDKIFRTIVITSVIALASFGLVITFSGGLWNIGIEGQIIAGAIGASFVARSAIGDQSFSPVVEGFSGAVMGSIVGVLCAVLKAKTNVHEIFAGLALDFVMAGLVVYLVIGPWKREGIASTSGTDIFPVESWLPLFTSYDFPLIPIVLSLFAFIIVLIVLKKTIFGLRLRSFGINPLAGLKYNISEQKYIFYSFAFSGGLGGLAGVVLASGIYHKLVPSISGGYGFLSILIVLLAARNPSIVLLVSFIFGALLVGGSQLQLKLGLHSSLSGIIQASFVLVWLIIKSLKIEQFIGLKIWSKFK